MNNKEIKKTYRIYTYWNKEKHYILKNGNLAPDYIFAAGEYKTYAKKSNALKIAKEKNYNRQNLRFYVEERS